MGLNVFLENRFKFMKGNKIVGKSLEGVVALCIKKIISYFHFVCCILYLILCDQLTVLYSLVFCEK